MTKHKKEKNENNSGKMKQEFTENEEKETLQTETAAGEDPETELKLQYDKLNDKYLRKIAEFENYKRRTDAEKSDFFSYANQKLISDLLPVLDDFERVLKAYDDKHDSDSLKKGVELVYEKFRGILAKHGLKQIDSDGKEFDVNLHEALFQQPDEDAKPNTIITTTDKGYFLKDKVLRHAKVIVSVKPEEK